ncbi:MAG: hypothetical protein Harvfovirus38_13 [Harvfovirus sp.]|uniref:Uncharacterized protein n=1 Tax=Harvfovirus sp. TaxID=2487768 RepID=A0A3G5A7U5_9VIRU|nr:MAG: hypothetical protein Harvfovirus38_13 [Harvfovirus sp.]
MPEYISNNDSEIIGNPFFCLNYYETPSPSPTFPLRGKFEVNSSFPIIGFNSQNFSMAIYSDRDLKDVNLLRVVVSLFGIDIKYDNLILFFPIPAPGNEEDVFTASNVNTSYGTIITGFRLVFNNIIHRASLDLSFRKKIYFFRIRTSIMPLTEHLLTLNEDTNPISLTMLFYLTDVNEMILANIVGPMPPPESDIRWPFVLMQPNASPQELKYNECVKENNFSADIFARLLPESEEQMTLDLIITFQYN